MKNRIDQQLNFKYLARETVSRARYFKYLARETVSRARYLKFNFGKPVPGQGI